MRRIIPLIIQLAVCTADACAQSSLTKLCTTSHIANSLPAVDGLTLDASTVTANVVLGYNVNGSDFQPDATFDFCNTTFSYSPNGKDETVALQFWLPAPEHFQNRYLSTGGGGFAISSGESTLSLGVPYGAVSGLTDGGFSASANFLNTFLAANDSINWESPYMFGYQAHHELALIGKGFTKLFYSVAEGTRLYSYWQGCSEGGREGMSQAQRYSGQFDGSVIGAPALRFTFQQVNHCFGGVATQTQDYFPPFCALNLITNETIAACDALDGYADGVVARTDLCMLEFDVATLIGKSYSCPALAATWYNPANPAVNGTINEQDVELVKTLMAGLHDSEGRRAYLPFQPSCIWADAATNYDSATNSFTAQVNPYCGPWVEQGVLQQNLTTLPNLDNVTYDTLRDWMYASYMKYYDSLSTTWPDLTPYKTGGGKILHFHGESDFSIPTAASVRYFESVRNTMHPNLNATEGAAAMADWYRLFLVPGAQHCGPNPLEPNGPFPQTNLAVIIDWVEKDVSPETLNGTILQGDRVGEIQQICAWPLRPLWTGNGTAMECVFDERGYQTWVYDLNAVDIPVY